MIKVDRFQRTIIAGLVLLSAGCGQVATPNPPDNTTLLPNETVQMTELPAEPISPTQGEPKPMTPSLIPPVASGLESLIDKAKEDLALRLSIPVTQISLVEAREVVWPDSSMGCPQPGMMYKQVPQDGALIILEVAARKYEYHVGGSRGLFLCEMVFKDPNPPAKIDLNTLTPPPAPDNSIPPGEGQ